MLIRASAWWVGPILSLCGSWTHAAELLADINPNPAPGSSTPRCLVTVGQLILFCAEDVRHGLELWVTDGTSSGTRLLKDIYPGPQSSQPQAFVEVGSRVFFVADDGTNGWELWVTDGTPAGTRIVVNMTPGGQEELNRWLLPYLAWNDELIFRYHRQPVIPAQLWRTNGTAQGTLQLTDLPADSDGPSEVSLFGGLIYFSMETDQGGSEVWATDGAAGGARRQAILPPGSGRITHFQPAGSALYFVTSRLDSVEIWVIDSPGGEPREVTGLVQGESHGHLRFHVFKDRFVVTRPSGTYAVTQGVAQRLGPAANSIVPAADRLYLLAEVGGRLEVHVSDGTVAGTQYLGSTTQLGLRIGSFLPTAVAGDRLLFIDNDELWMSDGTADGTQQFAFPDDEIELMATQLVSGEGVAYIRAISDSGPAAAYSIWRSDGTHGGTQLIHDDLRFTTNFLFMEYAAGTLFVAPHDPVVGTELFVSDGNGTLTLLADVNEEIVTENAWPGEHWPSEGIVLGPHYYFLANAGPDLDVMLWRTDGGTPEPLPFVPISGGLAKFGDRLIFEGHTEAAGGEPWVSDGTPAGTYALGDFSLGPDDGFATCAGPPVVAGRALFNVRAGDTNLRLYVSDGTPEGTEQFLPWDVPIPHFWLCDFGLVGDELVFRVGEDTLWKTDGTPAGTGPMFTSQIDHWGPHRFTESNGLLYFIARGATDPSTQQLWKTDGTSAGTVQVTDLSLAPALGIGSITPLGSVTVFVAGCAGGNRCVYRTDGSPAGTALVTAPGFGAIPHVESAGAFRPLPIVGGRAYMRGNIPGVFGSLGIYSTDGNTIRRDLLMPVDLHFTPFQAVGNRVFGVVPTASGTLSVGITDGTETGTGMLVLFSRGAGLRRSSNVNHSGLPRDFVVVGDSVLFAADDGAHGMEFWVIRAGHPSANADVASIPYNSSAIINVLANDGDIDGRIDPGSVQVVTPPAFGTVSVNATSGAVTYSPATNFAGADEFRYLVRDNDGKTSNVATVSVHVAQPTAAAPPAPPALPPPPPNSGGTGSNGGGGSGGTLLLLLLLSCIPRMSRSALQ